MSHNTYAFIIKELESMSDAQYKEVQRKKSYAPILYNVFAQMTREGAIGYCKDRLLEEEHENPN